MSIINSISFGGGGSRRQWSVASNTGRNASTLDFYIANEPTAWFVIAQNEIDAPNGSSTIYICHIGEVNGEHIAYGIDHNDSNHVQRINGAIAGSYSSYDSRFRLTADNGEFNYSNGWYLLFYTY